jgi:predicted outer membrane repeat protein
MGQLTMTGGSITDCRTTGTGRGTVHVNGTSSNVTLNNVTIRDNTSNYGGAIYVSTSGKITLDSDTIVNNTTNNAASGSIHLAGNTNGRLWLRDKNFIDGDIYINSTSDRIYTDEALLFSEVGAFRVLTSYITPGTVVVSPNGTTVTDASQFLTRFTLMNPNIGRGLDKGGEEEKHIILVNQFFIDGTKTV